MLPPIGLKSPAEVLPEFALESSALNGCLSGDLLESAETLTSRIRRGTGSRSPSTFPYSYLSASIGSRREARMAG
jgi:hypothetical protein